MAHEPAYIVQVDRHGNFSCDSLAADLLADLQATYKSQPWYSDKLTCKPFRQRVHDVMRRSGRGVVIVGPGMSFEAPPPFMEFFEPIQLGTNDPQMQTLSGAKPTRQEKAIWILIVLGLLVAVGGMIPLFIAFMRGQSRVVYSVLLMFGAVAVFVRFLIWFIQRVSGTWFLLPSAVAVRSRRKPQEPLVVLRPRETPALLRWVSNGKSAALILELWQADGKKWRRSVSEREAMTFLAAWRSDEVAPAAEKLAELLAT